MREQHQVRIGLSWGTLPVKGRQQWAQLGCDHWLNAAHHVSESAIPVRTGAEFDLSTSLQTHAGTDLAAEKMSPAAEMESEPAAGLTQAAEARSSIEIAVKQLQPPPVLRGNAGSEQESVPVASCVRNRR